MSEPHSGEFLRCLAGLRSPDAATPEARERLFALAYEKLRSIAAGLMRRERDGHTLQPTALVNEAYFKLAGPSEVEFRDRAHFLAVAARAMRQILVEYARMRGAARRAAPLTHLSLDGTGPGADDPQFQVLELERALDQLATLSERMARVVELRVFAGMTHEEVAEALGVSPRTAAEDWAVGRRWLIRELTQGTT